MVVPLSLLVRYSRGLWRQEGTPPQFRLQLHSAGPQGASLTSSGLQADIPCSVLPGSTLDIFTRLNVPPVKSAGQLRRQLHSAENTFRISLFPISFPDKWKIHLKIHFWCQTPASGKKRKKKKALEGGAPKRWKQFSSYHTSVFSQITLKYLYCFYHPKSSSYLHPLEMASWGLLFLSPVFPDPAKILNDS